MNRTFWVAWREFTSTAMTKGFVFGAVIFPVLMFGIIVTVSLFTREGPPAVRGEIAIIDRTPGAAVAPSIVEQLKPERLSPRLMGVDWARAGTRTEAPPKPPEGAASASAPASGLPAGIPTDPAAAKAALDAMNSMIDQMPRLETKALPPEADIDAERQPLWASEGSSGGRLALVVIAPDALQPAGQRKPGPAYEVFVRPKLDERVRGQAIEPVIRDAIIDARIRASGQDPAAVRGLMERPAGIAQAWTPTGPQRTAGAAQFIIPYAFMMLLWIAVMTGGQYLLTSTIEEKSNRIMEVLLSAVSPMQLMLGKILGQMAVGLLILVVYVGLAAGGLLIMRPEALPPLGNIGLLLCYFFIAYFTLAALMAAIGSAVTELHEAQSLMGPVMLTLMVPLIASPSIISQPNGTFATVASFIPPLSPFVMVLRLPTAEGVPTWQIAATLAIGLASVALFAWAAAKIFRIGVLMYGKPPNLATLIKWVRMA